MGCKWGVSRVLGFKALKTHSGAFGVCLHTGAYFIGL